MKRKLAWIAALAMFLSTAGCVEVSQAATSISAISESPAPLEEENRPLGRNRPCRFLRACTGGDQENYSASITFRQYSEMLTNLIRIWDPSRLGEWSRSSLMQPSQMIDDAGGWNPGDSLCYGVDGPKPARSFFPYRH